MKNNHSKGFRRFVKDKGYYIVLLLCAAAVGVSGYFLLTGSEEQPIQAEVSATVAPTRATNPSVKDVAATQATLPTAESTVPAAPSIQWMRPVDGDMLTAFAADHLAFNETTRDWRTHEGADYSAELGQEVLAAAEGTVHTIYEDESLGMTVVLRHDNGYTTHYSNLSEEVSVNVGDSLPAGAVLGTVGQTACTETAAASHLHFAVYQENLPVDPESLFDMD